MARHLENLRGECSKNRRSERAGVFVGVVWLKLVTRGGMCVLGEVGEVGRDNSEAKP